MTRPSGPGDISGRPDLSREEASRCGEPLRALFDPLGDGFCHCEMIVDESGAPIDFRVLEANPYLVAMSEVENLTGQTAKEIIGDFEPEWIERFARVGFGRQATRFEMASLASGRWFDVTAVPVEPYGTFVLVVRDQTARHRAEEVLRANEERFRTIADQLPLIVWAHDIAHQTNWVNEEFRRYFDLAHTDLSQDRWVNVLHPDDAPGYLAAFETAVTTRQPFHHEARVRRADGQWRWLESWATPRLDTEGKYVGHLGAGVDVTDHRTAETILRSVAILEAYRARLLATLRTIADPIEIQARAAQLLGEHLGAWRVHYAEVDPKAEFGIVHADYHPESSSVVGAHRFDDYGSAVMNEFRAGQVIVVTHVTADPRLTADERAVTAALDIGAYVMVPLARQGRPVAAFVVHHRGPHEFTEQELTIIEETADLTWSAVEQARAEETLRVRHARAELVAEVLSDLERQPTVATRVQRLAELLRAQNRRLRRGGGPRPPGATDRPRPPRPRTARHAARTAQRTTARRRPPALGHRGHTRNNTTRQHGRSDPPPRIRRRPGDPRPARPTGTPVTDGSATRPRRRGHRRPHRRPDRPPAPPYTATDLTFLIELAQRVSIVLAAARLRQEEHDISVRLQHALLPDELIWHPNVLVEARYNAASAMLDVGGDWYDTFTWPDGSLGVMVGDVVGHNLDSAAAMGRLRAATAALATHTPASPAALIEALDHFASGPNGTDFATVACVVIDPQTGRLTYSAAGHPPILVMPPNGPPIRLLDAQSVPLCCMSVGRRPERAIMLAPGSLVVLYSDGLVERRRHSIETGIARIEQLLGELADQRAEVVADRLIAETSADPTQDDDVVIACFRHTPVRARFQRTIPARGENLAGLRGDLRGWLTAQDVTGLAQHRTLLGVGEACGNAIEHAYPGRNRGAIDVEITHHGEHLTTRVEDHGIWRPTPRLATECGRGTGIMQAIGNRFLRRSDAGGTTVTLTLPLDQGPSNRVPAGRR